MAIRFCKGTSNDFDKYPKVRINKDFFSLAHKLFIDQEVEYLTVCSGDKPIAFCYNDENYPLEYRQELLKKEIEDDMAWIASRYQDKKDIYLEHGFDNCKLNRLIELMKIKLDYVSDNFADDRSFEWTGGFNFIITGIKV